jgi:hypothetical protein
VSLKLNLEVGKGLVRATIVRRKRTVWVGEAPFTTLDDLQSAIAQLASDKSLPGRPTATRIELQVPMVQVRTLANLPPVRASVLEDLVARQASRYFRRNGTPLVVAAQWLPHARGKPSVAQAAAAEEPWVEALALGARAAGLVLEGILPAGLPKEMLLFSWQERTRRRKAEVWARRRLALFAFFLWVAAGIALAVRFQSERNRVDRELAALQQPTRALLEARRALGVATGMVQAVAEADRDRARTLGRLAAITAALPDSAYLTSLSLDERGGTISGVAPQATRVVADLEKTFAIEAPRLTGPAVREVNGDAELERFSLTFGVRRSTP